MIKSFLILLSFTNLLFGAQQIILVVANDMNNSQAKLECFENGHKKFDTIHVNLGFNGLAWGLGTVEIPKLTKPELIKKEGDKRAPAGIFSLTEAFGYAQKSDTKLPYLHATKSLICIDDVNAANYNKIVTAKGDEKSFEYMKRSDELYKYGVVVGHNMEAKKGYGSCIFLHIQRDEKSPTLGCTSMKESDIRKIVKWLDEKKNPLLIQIPKQEAKEVLKRYPSLKASSLLKED